MQRLHVILRTTKAVQLLNSPSRGMVHAQHLTCHTFSSFFSPRRPGSNKKGLQTHTHTPSTRKPPYQPVEDEGVKIKWGEGDVRNPALRTRGETKPVPKKENPQTSQAPPTRTGLHTAPLAL